MASLVDVIAQAMIADVPVDLLREFRWGPAIRTDALPLVVTTGAKSRTPRRGRVAGHVPVP
jgi:hypothetical protein